MAVPKRVADRIKAGVKQYRDVLTGAKARDISEADTVTIVKDVMSDVFGFDKYAELTSEFQIRGTYCDLAIRVDGTVHRLIEVKAIGVELKEAHTRQAVNYGAAQGIEWVILTNGIDWKVYHILFQKPIATELVFCLNLLDIDARKKEDLEHLFLFSRESVAKQALREFKLRQDAVNRYVLAALLLNSETVESVLRRELNRTTGLRVDGKEILQMLRDEVIKRDVLEGEKAEDATKLVNRSESKSLRKSRKAKSVENHGEIS